VFVPFCVGHGLELTPTPPVDAYPQGLFSAKSWQLYTGMCGILALQEQKAMTWFICLFCACPQDDDHILKFNRSEYTPFGAVVLKNSTTLKNAPGVFFTWGMAELRVLLC